MSGARGGSWNVNFGGQAPGGGYRTMSEEEMREGFGDADPFSDFFHTFFGGAAAEEETGRRLHITRERARQIEGKAMEKLRHIHVVGRLRESV